MAQKRMFDKTITNSDTFLELPDSSQVLYFHLSMNADDDGFVNNWKSILRMTGTKEDDLKILISKQFVIPFESGVIVIKHWRINNYLRNDRYKSTTFKQELSMLNLNENEEYELNNESGIPMVYPDKNSIDKNIYSNTCINKQTTNFTNEELFMAFWSVYPKKKNKGTAEKWFKLHKPTKELVDTMIEKIEQQKESKDWLKNDGQFIPYPSTWLNAKGWEDEISEENSIPIWFDKKQEKSKMTKEEEIKMNAMMEKYK